jgi:hypothetical protein
LGLVRSRLSVPCLAATALVGLAMSPLLVGYEPVGNDPDLMYRPIKSELSRALSEGRLPYWSDRFGLGAPLAAESHAAAFYPPNWALYSALSTPAAYRLSMWLHYVLAAAATYAYARALGAGGWGAAISAVSFSLCGFQAVHAGHEPFYHVVAYLPLCLLLADRYATSGRLLWLALLAMAWGAQLTLGHFQIQMWTAGLVLLTGAWRVVKERRPRVRVLGLLLALAWGGAIAAAQLALTWELIGVASFDRSFSQLMLYSFPPAHWSQPALPGLFLIREVAGDPYWSSQFSAAGEVTFYVGTIPLILAAVGLVGDGRGRGMLGLWAVIAAAGFALASMARWWNDGYWLLVQLPGFGWFRAPARYTLLSSLGLALLAARGLDRSIPAVRFRLGLALAMAFGLAAAAWSAWWMATRPDLRASLGASTLPLRFGSAAVAWAVALVAIAAWRRGWMPPWGLVALTAVELGALYYCGAVRWGLSVPFPEDSPIVQRLKDEPGVGLVAGRLFNLPVRAGLTTAYPYFGIVPPPPNYLVEVAKDPAKMTARETRRWLARFGVTHGVWEDTDNVRIAKTLALEEDPALDRLFQDPSGPRRRRWKLVRYVGALPPVWVAVRVHEEATWGGLYMRFNATEADDDAWYVRGEGPPPSTSPRARSARLASWDGRTAVVEHDGACDLVVRRTHYPGWMASVDDGPERPVLKVNLGLQAVRLDGSGTSRVQFRYRPTRLRPAAMLSCVAVAAAVLTAGLGAVVGRGRAGAEGR